MSSAAKDLSEQRRSVSMSLSDNVIIGEGGLEVCSKLGQDLLRIFSDEIEPDVEFVVQGRSIKAHR